MQVHTVCVVHVDRVKSVYNNYHLGHSGDL